MRNKTREKTSIHLLISELKNINSFQSYEILKLNYENALLNPKIRGSNT